MKRTAIRIKKKKNRYRPSSEEKAARRKSWFSLVATMGGSLLFVLILSSICVYEYHYLITTRFLRIRGIKISGCEELKPEEVRSIAGVSLGENLLALNLGKIARKIKKNPWVKSVIINRGIPDQLFISIQEKKPIALVYLRKFYLIDREGKIILPVRTENFHGYPILTGINIEETLASGHISPKLEKELHDLFLAEEKNRDWFHSNKISEIHWSSEEGIVLFISREPIKIELGKSKFRLKLARLHRILSEASKRGFLNRITGINLRNTNRIFVRGKFPKPFISS